MSTLVYIIKYVKTEQHGRSICYVGVGDVQRVYESAKRRMNELGVNKISIEIDSQHSTREKALKREKQLIVEHSGFHLLNKRHNSYYTEIMKIRNKFEQAFTNYTYRIANNDPDPVLVLDPMVSGHINFENALKKASEQKRGVTLVRFGIWWVDDRDPWLPQEMRRLEAEAIQLKELPERHVKYVIQLMERKRAKSRKKGISWREARMMTHPVIQPSLTFESETETTPKEMEYIVLLILNAQKYYNKKVKITNDLGGDKVRWHID